jgi:phage pi2 protein 07
MTSIFLSFILFLSSPHCSQREKMQQEFHTLETTGQIKRFLKTYEDTNCEDIKPYLFTARMLLAKNVFWPHQKINHFTFGKKQLEEFIKKNPQHLEAKYLRMLVQQKCPSFLKYNANLLQDRIYVLKHLKNSSLSSDYKKTILKNTELL